MPLAPPVCRIADVPPGTFHQTGSIEIPSGNHVGLRLSFKDAAGRRLNYTAGVEGEFAEGGKSVGTYEIATDGQGELFATADITWVLVWQEAPPCDTHTVAGNGFSRGEFLRVLLRSGTIASID